MCECKNTLWTFILITEWNSTEHRASIKVTLAPNKGSYSSDDPQRKSLRLSR